MCAGKCIPSPNITYHHVSTDKNVQFVKCACALGGGGGGGGGGRAKLENGMANARVARLLLYADLENEARNEHVPTTGLQMLIDE